MESGPLREILELPELYCLVNSFYEWALPPAQPVTTTVTLVVGLGRASASVLVAAISGASLRPLKPRWEILLYYLLEAERAALAKDPAYVSTTP